MSNDLQHSLRAVRRSVEDAHHDGEPVRRVVLQRRYATTAEDLWNAVTTPERLVRWFLPVSGDLVPGGHYQLEGNAGGSITRCEPPQRLDLTWEFGGGVSWVEVHIAADGDDGTSLTLVHICPLDDFWRRYGPGAVGVGWDLGLLGLHDHLSGAPRLDEEALATSPEGQAFIGGASDAWGIAATTAGEAPEAAQLRVRRTTAFYTGQPEPEA